jgi:hypothetical protein
VPPLHHCADKLVVLQVQRRQGQAAVLAVQEVATEDLQAPDRAVQQGADDRLGGLVPGQRLEVK